MHSITLLWILRVQVAINSVGWWACNEPQNDGNYDVASLVSCHVSSMSTSNIELSLADRDAENNTASPPPAASAADDNDLACPSRPSPPSSSCKLLADVSPSCPLHWNLGSSAGNPAHSCHSQIFDNDYIRNTVHENLKKYAAKHQSIEYHES